VGEKEAEDMLNEAIANIDANGAKLRKH